MVNIAGIGKKICLQILIFTARKRSLRRLCFYRCLSFILFTGGACVAGGVCAWQGGVCMAGGACMAGGGHAWQGGGRAWQGGCAWQGGACVVLFSWGGGHARFYSGGCMVLFGGGVRGFIWGGACVVLFGGGVRGFIRGGMRGFIRGGVRGFFQFFRIQWDTVNERAVRILLECILVSKYFQTNVFNTLNQPEECSENKWKWRNLLRAVLPWLLGKRSQLRHLNGYVMNYYAIIKDMIYRQVPSMLSYQ